MARLTPMAIDFIRLLGDEISPERPGQTMEEYAMEYWARYPNIPHSSLGLTELDMSSILIEADKCLERCGIITNLTSIACGNTRLKLSEEIARLQRYLP
jgi:hypothetical protein